MRRLRGTIDHMELSKLLLQRPCSLSIFLAPILFFFLNSSLAPVLLFRRSFVSVCNVLKGIRLHGFSEARVAALWCRWRAVVRMGPTGHVTSFEP